MFQEPKAPVKLPVMEDVSSVLEAAKVSEEEITGCCFKGVFITKFDGKLLRFIFYLHFSFVLICNFNATIQ